MKELHRRVYDEVWKRAGVITLRKQASTDYRDQKQILTTSNLSAEFSHAPTFESSIIQGDFKELPGCVWNILVNVILESKQRWANAKTDAETNRLELQHKSLDRQIDEAVYELYGLTEEEIKIVEGKR